MKTVEKPVVRNRATQGVTKAVAPPPKEQSIHPQYNASIADARTRRESRSERDARRGSEGRALVSKVLDKPGGRAGAKYDDGIMKLVEMIEDSSKLDLKWLHCLLYPSEDTKCGIPDKFTTQATAKNFFRATGTITTSNDTVPGDGSGGNLVCCFFPFLSEGIQFTRLSGTGGTCSVGVPSGTTGRNDFSQLNSYAQVVKFYRAAGYAVVVRYIGNLTNAQGRFAIAALPPNFNIVNFDSIASLPNARVGSVPEIFEKGDYYYTGEFFSADSSATSGFGSDWNMLAFHQVDQHASAVVPNLCLVIEGQAEGSTTLSVEFLLCTEGLPDNTVVPVTMTPVSSVAATMANVAAHPVVKDHVVGFQKHHRSHPDGGIVSTVFNDAQKTGKWVIDHWDDIKDVGSDVLSTAAKAAGYLGPIAAMLL